MKLYLSILIFLPILTYSQEIICLDTVTISGYFYKIKDNRLSPEAFTNDNEHFNYIPESSLETNSFYSILIQRLSAEKDTIKFLSFKPTKDLSFYTKESCLNCLEKAINIYPFSNEIKLHKIKGVKNRQVQISFVKVTWLHLKIKKSVACGYGFDKPASLFCDSSNELLFDIYVPLKLIDLNNSIKLKRGRFYKENAIQANDLEGLERR